MTAGEDDKRKEQGKGFAGLSSLLSDVNTTPAVAAEKPTANPSGNSAVASRSTPQAAPPTQQQAPPQQPYEPPQQPSSGSSASKWWIGIAVVVGIFWLIGQSNKNTSSPSTAYSPSAQSTPPSYSASPQPHVPTRPAEAKPPVGQDLVLSREQIAYCVAEDIRMDGEKSAVDNFSGSDVDRFNAMVADFNSRCRSFRYRSGALESVRSSVEPFRSQLYSDGRQRFVQYRPRGSISTPASRDANNSRHSTVARTDSPPRKPNSRPTSSDIALIKQKKTNVTDRESIHPGFPAPTEMTSAPVNSWKSGSNWYCNNGYRRVGNSCEQLNVPANAWVSGSNWYCNNGYRRVGDKCISLFESQHGG